VFERVVGWATRRPIRVLLGVAALTAVGVLLALGLRTSASTDTLVGRGSESFAASERAKQDFGEDPVVVLVKGDLTRTLLTSDLGRLITLEGCLSGRASGAGLAKLPPECRRIAEQGRVKVVYGPGTFINTAAGQIGGALSQRSQGAQRDAEAAAEGARRLGRRQKLPKAQTEQAAAQARRLVEERFQNEILAAGVRYGLTAVPSIDNPQFVSQLVFDPSQGRANAPKARFGYLFPSSDAAVVQVRLRPGLSEAERDETIGQIQAAVGSPAFAMRNGGRYVVSGVPVVVAGLAREVERAIFVLLAAGVLVMAATLALVFRARLRLAPLLLALAATGMTFGALRLVGGSLTMASIAALPVLIGLAVDYAIQFHSRWEEARRAGAEPRPAASAAAVAGGPTIAAAGLATGAGFLVLFLSPVPMVRGFGAILVFGVAVSFALALTAGFAVLTRFGRRSARPEDLPPLLPRARAVARRGGQRLARPLRRLAPPVAAMRRGAGRTGRGALDLALARPRRVLGIGLAIAALGWAADTQTEVISDVRQLVPGDLPALRDVATLQRATGVTGELDVTVRGSDLTSPAAIAWMGAFQQEVLSAHGYREGLSCAQGRGAPELCPGFSLPDLFASGGPGSRRNVTALLDAVPPYFSQAVLSPDRRTAQIAFGIRLMSLEQQGEVVDDLKERLDPPPGIEASVTGLPVLGAEGNAALSSTGRRLLTLAVGLLLVFGVLLLLRRDARRAAIPLIPIALATGWSALVLFILRIPLNPMSAALGALVIAISTEFSVLLSARYEEERAAGAERGEALRRTYASTGAAVFASGATAIAGFAALMFSDIRMLRDFGAVTVIDLIVSLLGVLFVLPAALAWAEEHGPFRLSDLDPRLALASLRRGRVAAGAAGGGRARSANPATRAVRRLRSSGRRSGA
jgi:hydrophobe/amphiphile efflux-3 (HAE3) family protein